MGLLALADIARARAERSWCLFVDRDGVINARILDGYVCSWREFEFLPGALDALHVLAQWAPHIVVVTNQQGVGKDLMTRADLDSIHVRMIASIVGAGGRIDAVKVCPHLVAEGCSCRKPAAGMALDYLSDHPEIDASLSVMVGDTDSDMAMGRRLGDATGGCAVIRIDHRQDAAADETYASLADFAHAVNERLVREKDVDSSFS